MSMALLFVLILFKKKNRISGWSFLGCAFSNSFMLPHLDMESAGCPSRDFPKLCAFGVGLSRGLRALSRGNAMPRGKYAGQGSLHQIFFKCNNLINRNPEGALTEINPTKARPEGSSTFWNEGQR